MYVTVNNPPSWATHTHKKKRKKKELLQQLRFSFARLSPSSKYLPLSFIFYFFYFCFLFVLSGSCHETSVLFQRPQSNSVPWLPFSSLSLSLSPRDCQGARRCSTRLQITVPCFLPFIWTDSFILVSLVWCRRQLAPPPSACLISSDKKDLLGGGGQLNDNRSSLLFLVSNSISSEIKGNRKLRLQTFRVLSRD